MRVIIGVFCATSLLLLSAVGAMATDVLVASAGSNAVLRYTVNSDSLAWTADGTFAAGTYAGNTLQNPLAIATNSLGDVYVAEASATGRILRFDSGGNFQGVVAREGVDFTGNPDDLTIGPDGNLYLSCAFGTSSDRIYKVNTASDAVSLFVPTTGTGYTLDTPRGITFGPDGNLYVANRGPNNATGRDLLRFNGTTGDYIDTFAAGLQGPTALTYDSAGGVFYASVGTGYGDIEAIGPDGTTSSFFHNTASDGSTFLDILPLDGRVYASDSAGDRIVAVTGPNQLTTVVASGLMMPGHMATIASIIVPESPTFALIGSALLVVVTLCRFASPVGKAVTTTD